MATKPFWEESSDDEAPEPPKKRRKRGLLDDSSSDDDSGADTAAAFHRLRERNLVPDPDEVASDDEETMDRGMAMVQEEKKVVRRERAEWKRARAKARACGGLEERA